MGKRKKTERTQGKVNPRNNTVDLVSELNKDGWYYADGYRFHAVCVNSMFTRVWDLEKI